MKCDNCGNQARHNSRYCFEHQPKKIAVKKGRSKWKPVERDRRRAPVTPEPDLDPYLPRIINLREVT